MILQSLFKVERYFVIANLRVKFTDDSNSINVREKNEIEFIIESTELSGKNWNDELSIGWIQFTELWKSYFKINPKQFFLNFGFSSQQKRIIISNLTKNLAIHNSKLLYTKNDITEKPINHVKEKEEKKEYWRVNLYSELKCFIKENNLKDKMYFEIFQKFQNSLKNPKLKETPNNNKVTKEFCPNIRLMNPGDPSYGKVVEAIDKLKVFSGMKVLDYYNTIKIGMGRYYYMTIFNGKYKINLKIELVCEDDIPEQQRFIKIASYSPLQGILDYSYIKDPMTRVYNI